MPGLDGPGIAGLPRLLTFPAHEKTETLPPVVSGTDDLFRAVVPELTAEHPVEAVGCGEGRVVGHKASGVLNREPQFGRRYEWDLPTPSPYGDNGR